MYAKELMIGDWVHYIDSHSFQIETIGRTAVEAKVNDGEYSLDKIEPIPLTPEILMANGFDARQDSFAFWEGATLSISLYFMSRLYITDYASGYRKICEITKETWYVHDLQNILRICGFTDLADNFKA